MKKNSVVSVVRDFHLIVVKKGIVVSKVSEERQRSEGSQIFYFNSGESKTA